MTKRIRSKVPALLLAAAVLLASAPLAHALDKRQLNQEADAALKLLYKSDTSARLLASKARAILVFPSILKAGFMFGGQMGNGVLKSGGRNVGYYNSMAASYGLQAGIQRFGYALFFMNNDALAYLDKSEGWEVGVGPSIVIVDKGKGKSLTSTTLTQDVYAYIFNQKGLMAGLGIQGSKITKLSE